MNFAYKYLFRNNLFVFSVLFILALTLRIQLVNPNLDHIYTARDAKQYIQYAHNLFQHGVFSRSNSPIDPQPDSFRSPGYPLYIAFMMWMAGEQSYLMMLVYSQAVLSALLVPLTFLAGRFFLPFYGALIAAVMVCFSPHLITIAGCVLTETLFSFFLLASICCFHYTLKKKPAGLFIFSAILFGCTCLINETALLLPCLLFIFLFLSKHLAKYHILKKMVLFLMVFSIAPIGWSLRNHLNVPPESEKGMDRAIVTMSHGAYPDFIYKNPRYKRFPYREDPMQPAFGNSFENFVQILWARVKAEPVRYVKWYLVGKAYYLWSWNIIQGVGDVYIYPVGYDIFKDSKSAEISKSIMQQLHSFWLLLFWAGIPLFYREFKTISADAAILCTPFLHFSTCIYFTFLYCVFAPWPRYSIPLRAEFYLFCVWSLIAIHKLISSRFRVQGSKVVSD